MPFAAYAETTNLYTILIGVASYCGLAKDGLPLALNPTSNLSAAYAELARICNRVHEQVTGDNPQFNQTTIELELVSGTLEYDIPEDLFRAEIMDIRYQDTNGVFQGFPINYCSPNDFELLWGMWQNTQGVSLFPRNYTLNDNLGKIKFTGFNQSGTYLLRYRTQPDGWVAADVNDSASTTVANVPDTFIDVLEMLIAVQVLTRMGKLDRLAIVQGQLNDRPGRTRKSRYEELIYHVATVGASKNRQWRTSGKPVTQAYPTRYGGAGRYRLGQGGLGIGVRY